MHLKGLITVEAAVIFPLFMLVFCVALNALFYAHDKTLMGVAAHETVVVGSGENSPKVEEIEQYFGEQVNKKTMLYHKIGVNVEVNGDILKLQCTAKKNGMQVSIQREARMTEPENYIRKIRKVGGFIK